MKLKMSCSLKLYDIDLLSKANLPIDRLCKHVTSFNISTIRQLTTKSRIWKDFYDITPELVSAFEAQAYAHVKYLKENKSQYGYLYFIAENNKDWFNTAHFEYEQFPLMVNRPKVLNAIRRIAQRISPSETIEFDATCLYLLYFYGLLANPHSNWITMDYLTNGNKHHQYGTRLKGKMIKTVTNKWV